MYRFKFLLTLLVLAVTPYSVVLAETDWNSDAIAWFDYHTALERAQVEKKAIMLILHSEGCGACREYSVLFHTPEIVKAAQQLIMVVVDDGSDEVLSDKYSPDGAYVPRTFFLSCNGELLDIAVGKPDSRFQYYYDSRKPDRLVETMRLANQVACSPG